MNTARTGIPDAGASEIRRLLTAPDPALEAAARQLAITLPHGFQLQASPTARQIIIDPTLIAAIARIRSIYRGLRARITAIQTNNGNAKSDVLAAIDLVDTSYTLLLRSTDARSYAAYSRLVHDARSRQAHAARELQSAIRKLS